MRPVTNPPTASRLILKPSGATSVRATVQAVASRTIASRKTLLQPSAGERPRKGWRHERPAGAGAAIDRLTLTTPTPGKARAHAGEGPRDRLAVLDKVSGDTRCCQRTHDEQ